jgi:acetolactate synthase-1/2/3 large subunit
MRVSDYVAKFLKLKKVNKIFMLTGYGAMYLNDSIKKNNIKYFATRNEATAPIMAAAFSRVTGKIGVACVTAGPGATNAIPGLAEAYVDSSPVLIISGQVNTRHTTLNTKLAKIRTFGTAEINIIPIVKPLTKYCTTVLNPNHIKYVLQKAYYECLNGRPGPVWIDIPLDVQNARIDLKKLKTFYPSKKKLSYSKKKLNLIVNEINKCSKPLIICGQGVKISKQYNSIKNNISKRFNIPIMFTRAAQDLDSHKKKLILGQGGIKGTAYCKDLMNQSDLVLSFGCRMAPQFAGHDFEIFKNAKIVSVDIEKDELEKKGVKHFIKENSDLTFFVPKLISNFNKNCKKNFRDWARYCEAQKNKYIENVFYKRNPIDLYYFMNLLGKNSPKKSILITDAGSNYYIGGQVWKFENGQKEITSITNAAMGLSIPLAIGASVGSDPKVSIFAVTGDGSLELNIQELKTMSHYNLNVKLFVINNGGYVSMHNWADNYFKGRRVDNSKDTGEGTLNFKNVAKAFDLDYYKIYDYKKILKDLNVIKKNKKPMLIEVVTDSRQTIFDAFKDR